MDAHNGDVMTIDGPSIRVHHAAATKKNDPLRCMGRSRGGFTAKIHTLVNGNALPLRFLLTPGEAHGSPPCRILLDAVQPNQMVLAGRAYDADWIR